MSSGFSRLPLQKKVALTLLLTISAFAAISYLILSVVIAPAFDDLDIAAAKTDLVRAQRALHADIENLDEKSADWALWDDIYTFAVDRNRTFRRTNLVPSTLPNLDLDMMAIYAANGDALWSEMRIDGPARGIGELGILGANDPQAERLIRHRHLGALVSGIVQTNLGPMIVSARPILHSDSSGPIAGSLVIAQFLDEARLDLLKERTELNLRWVPFDKFARAPTVDVAALQPGDTRVVTDPQLIASYTVLSDISGAPALVLSAKSSREISALGLQTVRAAMIFLLGAGVLVTIVIWYLLRRTMLKPISLLAAHMDDIRQSGDLSRALKVNSNDEIGTLALQFNRLTSEVHEARKALLYQSYRAGKADTAAEVLHNIRNAMTPMINGAERLGKALRVVDELRVADAVEQLRDADCPPERAAKLVDYVEASFEHIRKTNIEAADDVRTIMSQARQVEAIMADQEKFANAAPLAEAISVDEVVSEAANIIPKDAMKRIEVALDENLQGLRVHAHRIGLLQVLGNLILNAYESIQRTGQDQGCIHLSASEEVVDDRAMVRLTVADNGTGFGQELKNRVFQRGFTSKGQGDTTGLGLHWCANAVAGMGGRISADSSGAGKGAEFHVLLPASQGA
jgi:signal transduction histidine kinase